MATCPMPSLYFGPLYQSRITKLKLLTPLDFPPHSPISNQSQNPSQSPQTHLEIFLISAHPSQFFSQQQRFRQFEQH